jgi:hypothetical protein
VSEDKNLYQDLREEFADPQAKGEGLVRVKAMLEEAQAYTTLDDVDLASHHLVELARGIIAVEQERPGTLAGLEPYIHV